VGAGSAGVGVVVAVDPNVVEVVEFGLGGLVVLVTGRLVVVVDDASPLAVVVVVGSAIMVVVDVEDGSVPRLPTVTSVWLPPPGRMTAAAATVPASATTPRARRARRLLGGHGSSTDRCWPHSSPGPAQLGKNDPTSGAYPANVPNPDGFWPGRLAVTTLSELAR
jgi:hypothetical protein